MSQPKLPSGPAPVGTAAVRAIEGQGASWQNKQGYGYKAVVKDGFSRVTLDAGITYVTDGQYGPAAYGSFGTQRYQTPFTPVKAIFYDVNCDKGYFASATSPSAATYEDSYNYPMGNGTTYNYTYRVLERTWTVELGKTSQPPVGTVRFLYDYTDLLSFPVSPSFAYAGRVVKAGSADIKVFAASLTDGSRTDSVGRPLLDPAISFVYKKAPQEDYYLPVPNSSEEEFFRPLVFASSAITYCLVFERFAAYGPRNLTRDYRPPVWLMASLDGGTTWSTYNVRAAVADDFDLPRQYVAQWNSGLGGYNTLVEIPLVGGTATITDTALYGYSQTVGTTYPVYPFNKYSARDYIFKVNGTTMLTIGVMCADGVLVLAIPYLKLIADVLTWKNRVVRITDNGATATAVYTSAGGTDTEHFQSMVYVGGTTVVAKKVKGFGGVDFDVSFMISTDLGATWADTTPTGFLCPLKNQYFGNLSVDRAQSDTKPARLLITSWDAEALAYYLFSSLDNGATWTKKGKIKKPDAFRRIDSMLAGDGGGNFRNLAIIDTPNNTRYVDPALPGRYVRNPT